MRTTAFRILIVVSIFALLVAACSSSSPEAEAPAPQEAAAPAATPVQEAAAAPSTDASTTTVESAGDPPAGDPAAMRTFAIVPEQTTATYMVDEQFLGQNLEFVKTVGQTSAIEGSLQMAIDGSTLSVGDNQFTVDLRTLTSDRPRRDNAIRDRWLESNTYPWAIFTATGVSDLPADAATGQDVSFKLNGNITIREIPQPITWDVTAKLDGSTLSGTATTLLFMRDFGFEPPDIAGMLKVTDGVSVTLNFFAEEVQ